MTKVEELRQGIVDIITIPSAICGDPIDTEAVACVDSLISAARSEGVAEGAEKEREKWIGGNETDEENDKRGQTLEARLMGKPSVLAPAKVKP